MGKSYSKNKDSLKHLEMRAENEKDKMLAVLKQSIKDLVEDANTTVNDGGRMRVDTGFLRSSGVAALNEIPKDRVKVENVILEKLVSCILMIAVL